MHEFGRRYRALIERYQHVVRFSSWGHTHYESFFVQKAEGTNKAISWGLVHGSVVPFVGRNPEFYVIKWDEETMVPINIYAYTLNITAANLDPEREPSWYLMHDYLSEYNLPDLSPSSIKSLSETLYNDINYAKKFQTNHEGEFGTMLSKSNQGKYKPADHDIFYKCLQEIESDDRFDCMFKGTWDFLGLYHLAFGNLHYKKLISFWWLDLIMDFLIGKWIV